MRIAIPRQTSSRAWNYSRSFTVTPDSDGRMRTSVCSIATVTVTARWWVFTKMAFAAFRVSVRRHHWDSSCSMSALIPSTLWAIVARPRFVPLAISVASNVVGKLGMRGARFPGDRKGCMKPHQVSTCGVGMLQELHALALGFISLSDT